MKSGTCFLNKSDAKNIIKTFSTASECLYNVLVKLKMLNAHMLPLSC